MEEQSDETKAEKLALGEIMQVMGRNSETLLVESHNNIVQLYLKTFSEQTNLTSSQDNNSPTTKVDNGMCRLGNEMSPPQTVEEKITQNNTCLICNKIAITNYARHEDRMSCDTCYCASPVIGEKITQNDACLICNKIVPANSSRLNSKAKCDKCDCIFCDSCYIKRCDIGGGQDQNVYFSCPRCRCEIIRDKDLLEYFLRRCDLTMETATQKYREWVKSGRGKIVIKYEVREAERYSSW